MIRALIAHRRGTSAVEFALLGPIFCLLFAATADVGGVLYVRFNLDGSVSAAASYALNNASRVNATSGGGLAGNIASILASSHATNWANGTVVVNDGPSTTVTGGVTSTGGSAAAADSCYCPSTGASGIAWGNAVACGAACANGSVAGKFVTITANRTYTPIFASYGIIANGAIVASTMVQVQ